MPDEHNKEAFELMCKMRSLFLSGTLKVPNPELSRRVLLWSTAHQLKHDEIANRQAFNDVDLGSNEGSIFSSPDSSSHGRKNK